MLKCLMLTHHRKVKKKLFRHISIFISDSAPVQIHNYVYNMVGIYFEKVGTITTAENL